MTILAVRPGPSVTRMDPDSIPVISKHYPGRITRPAPGPAAAGRVATLAELHAPRLASAIRVVEPLPETNAAAVRAIVERMTANELFEAQVLAGHVVTAIVKERRRREQEASGRG